MYFNALGVMLVNMSLGVIQDIGIQDFKQIKQTRYMDNQLFLC